MALISASDLDPVADDSLNHKRVLEVTNAVAPLCLALLDTSTLAAAPEAVGFFAVAESVDERAQLPHVPHPPRHHHLLLDDVRLRKVRPSLDIGQQLPQVTWRHHQGRVQLGDVTFVQGNVMVSCEAPLKVMDDVGRVAASKVRHRHADLFVVVIKVDADILLDFLPAPQRSEHRVLIDNPTVEQAVLWDLLRYEVVAIDVDRGQHQS